MCWVLIVVSLTKEVLGRPLPAGSYCSLRNSGVLSLSLHPGTLYKTTLSMVFTFFLLALKSPIDGHGLPYQREGFRNSKGLIDSVLITRKVWGWPRRTSLSTSEEDHYRLSLLTLKDSKFPCTIKGNAPQDMQAAACVKFHTSEIALLFVSKSAFLHVRVSKSVSYSIPRLYHKLFNFFSRPKKNNNNVSPFC